MPAASLILALEKPVTPSEDVSFGINPVIASIQPVMTRGIITNFTDNDRIGLFLTDGELGTNYQGNEEAANVPAVYLQGAWKVDKDIVLTEEGTAFAYYPYNDKVTDGAAVPLEIGFQTDYLYATPAAVDEKNPIAQIGMKHALALVLVSVRIRKNDYQYAGKLTKIEVLDVQMTGTPKGEKNEAFTSLYFGLTFELRLNAVHQVEHGRNQASFYRLTVINWFRSTPIYKCSHITWFMQME